MRSTSALWQRFWADMRSVTSLQACVAMALASLLLVLPRYTVKPGVFRSLFPGLRSDPLFELYGYAWWYLGATALYVVVPLVVWRTWLGTGARALGCRCGDPALARPLLPVGAIMLVVAVAVGFLPDFARKYPLCDLARERWDVFAIYEVLYGLYFFSWEFIFRGWMLNALIPTFGPAAIWIQAMPFTLMHAGKPLPEAVGALPAGLFLGWIAWRSRSFVYGWLLHWGVALLLDATVTIRHHLSQGS